MNAVLMTLEMVADFISVIAQDAAGTGILTPAVGTILSAGATLIKLGDQGATELQALTGQIKQMVTANRDPTESEWDALKARSDAAHATIQGNT